MMRRERRSPQNDNHILKSFGRTPSLDTLWDISVGLGVDANGLMCSPEQVHPVMRRVLGREKLSA